MHLLGKEKIITPEVGRAAMTTLAHYHGIWIKWLNNAEPPKTIGGHTPEDFKRVFTVKFHMNWMKDLLKGHKYFFLHFTSFFNNFKIN